MNLSTGEACSLDLLADAIAALVTNCAVKHAAVAQPQIRLSAEKARKVLGWRSAPRSFRLRTMLAAAQDDFCDKLQRIALDVGQLLLDIRSRGPVAGNWEGTQFKAAADIQSHQFWCRRLRLEFPTIPVVSEEDSGSFTLFESPEYWLIDPIDGTASYAEGYSGFVTQAALVREGQLIYSVVFAPALDLCYVAGRGFGATLNGTAMVNLHPDRFDVLIDNYPVPQGVARQAYAMLNFNEYIECGSIGLKLCKVAQGAADLFVKSVPVKPWDLAPAHLVLREVRGMSVRCPRT